MTAGTSSARFFFVRRAQAGDLLDVFLVAAVVTLLAIRAFLAATGYPQVGGSTLHIAHVLWGGLGMMAALVLVFSLQGSFWLLIAALGGGAGFGTFIDELGKFITQDNDYFFQPTIALIYLVFVGMYLAFRSIGQLASITDEERIVSALDLTKEAVIRDLSPKELAAADRLLTACDQTNPTVAALQRILRDVPTTERTPGFAARLAERAQRVYSLLVGWRRFRGVLISLFVVLSLLSLCVAVLLMADVSIAGLQGGWQAVSNSEFAAIGQTAAALGTGALSLVGVLRLRRARLSAYRWFSRAVLVQVFVGQFFEFYTSQLAAISGLVALLLIWACLRIMISGEQARLAHQGAAAPAV